MLTPTTPMAVSEDTVPTPATTTTTTTMSPAFRISVTRVIKGFLTTVALAALAYWLVQVAGMQYLATLTSATLLTLLLVYIVWCLTVRKNQHHQVLGGPRNIELGRPITDLASSADMRSPSYDLNKMCSYAAPRDCSPPPSYEEAVRGLVAAQQQQLLYQPLQQHSPSVTVTLTENPMPAVHSEGPSSSASLDDEAAADVHVITVINEQPPASSASSGRDVTIAMVSSQEATDETQSPKRLPSFKIRRIPRQESCPKF